MNVLNRITVFLGVFIVGGYLAYHHVLSDEQRADVAAAQEELKKAMEEISDAVMPLVSKGTPTKAQERAAAEANRARTAQQWEAIGY
ncbi:MAG: hypothetical protein IKG18_17285 [Atopobiaceae bacterium]|nr:hypothetical protein [Atopobiaceae bacterium]MBR3315876.1 hypothetical protein [Atopobiaceae bacterium]